MEATVRKKLVAKWNSLPLVERSFRDLVWRLYVPCGASDRQDGLGPWADADREIHVSAFFGHYGICGYVVAVNGSPPHGIMLVYAPHFLDNGIIESVYFIDNYRRSKKVVGYSTGLTEAPAKKLKVILDYLLSVLPGERRRKER